jgi:hypothetical protein
MPGRRLDDIIRPRRPWRARILLPSPRESRGLTYRTNEIENNMWRCVTSNPHFRQAHDAHWRRQWRRRRRRRQFNCQTNDKPGTWPPGCHCDQRRNGTSPPGFNKPKRDARLCLDLCIYHFRCHVYRPRHATHDKNRSCFSATRSNN